VEKTILVAGQQGILDAAVARAAVARGFRVVLARDPQGSGGEGVAGLEPIRWNPPSPLSARAVMLECGEGPEALVIALERFGFPGDFQLASPAQIDESIDSSLRGALLIAREAVAKFAKKSSGCIVFALRETEGPGPIALALVAAIKEFALALNTGSGQGLRVYGISCAPGQEDALADQAIEFAGLVDDKRPQSRWIKVGGRSFPWAR
jgi:NAD(P)-dependent dehydrogenase (short-subunit alcohol dehydrogenase family)